MEGFEPDEAIEFQTDLGAVTIIWRSLPLDELTLIADLLPFYELPTLMIQASDESAQRTFRGRVQRISQEVPKDLTLAFASEDNLNIEIDVRAAVKRILIIWRVNDSLDALQVCVSNGQRGFYLQTGGNLLLKLIASAVGGSSAVEMLTAVFNEPIYEVQKLQSLRTDEGFGHVRA